VRKLREIIKNLSSRQKKIAGYTTATAGFAGVNAVLYGVLGHEHFYPITPVDLVAASKLANSVAPHLRRAIHKVQKYNQTKSAPIVIRSNRYMKEGINKTDLVTPDAARKKHRIWNKIWKADDRGKGHWLWKGEIKGYGKGVPVYQNKSVANEVFRQIRGKKYRQLYRTCDDSRCVSPYHHTTNRPGKSDEEKGAISKRNKEYWKKPESNKHRQTLKQLMTTKNPRASK